MTNEEAKVFLLQLHTDKQLNKSEHEALRVAIKALEAPPNDNWEGYSSRLWKNAYERGYDEGYKQACKDKIESPYCAESEDNRTEEHTKKHVCDYIDIDKAVEHYEGTLEVLKDIDLEDKV